MTSRGKLIAIEGIDGSGKRTQLDLLARALEARGVSTMRIGFPRYSTFFGKLAGQYLNGDFGSLASVDPHFSALIYAGDRFEAKNEMELALASGKMVLADRYIASNLAHQSERVPQGRRDDFIAWMRHLEYSIYGLPVEDLVIYLRVPIAEAQRLVGMKAERPYTTLTHDIQEKDISHLEQTASIYDHLTLASNWVRIDCTNNVSGELFSREEIHRAVLKTVESRILSQPTALL